MRFWIWLICVVPLFSVDNMEVQMYVEPDRAAGVYSARPWMDSWQGGCYQKFFVPDKKGVYRAEIKSVHCPEFFDTAKWPAWQVSDLPQPKTEAEFRRPLEEIFLEAPKELAVGIWKAPRKTYRRFIKGHK